MNCSWDNCRKSWDEKIRLRWDWNPCPLGTCLALSSIVSGRHGFKFCGGLKLLGFSSGIFSDCSSLYFKSNVPNFDEKSRYSLVRYQMATKIFLVLSEDYYSRHDLVFIHQNHPEIISVDVSCSSRELGRWR